jgi:hypothetical protein
VDTARRLTDQIIARRRQELPPDPLRELGRQLFDAVFAGRRKVLFDRCREAAREAGTGLRVRVVPRAADGRHTRWLPWEYLYDARRADFLALSMLTRVVRDVGRPPHDLITLVAPPVRALVVTADVTGAMGAAEEVERLRRIAAHSRRRLRLTVLEARTAPEFLDAVRTRDYHVLHFIGTGVPTGPGLPGQPGLVLMPESRRADPVGGYGPDQVVAADALVAAVGDQPGVRLVFLDACHTDELAAGLAAAVQGAVGVRGYSSVAACMAFAQDLYRAVVRGEPLDTAVTSARQQVDHRLTGSREWGLQTFYLQTPDGEFARWPRAAGLTAGWAADVTAPGRDLPPDRRKAALVRALLERNRQALADLIDRAGGDVPDVVREQLRTIQARLKKL